MDRVLDQARSMSYAVGTNLKGRGAAGAWTFLLPDRSVETALVVGRIDDAERSVIEGIARRTLSITTGNHLATLRDLPDDAAIDLVRIGRGGERLLKRRRALADALAARLSPGGSAYLEGRHGRRDGLPAGMGASAVELDLAPVVGRARVLVPTGDERTRAELHRLGHLPATGSVRSRAGIANRIVRRVAPRLRRRAWLATSPPGPAGPPRYVVDVARTAGTAIEAHRWALLAPGDYATQKLLLLLFEPATGEPSAIVKLGGDVEHAGRLANEAAMLERLATLRLGQVPIVLFAGSHAGRGIVGESWIEGRAFRALATTAPDCPYLADATAWLGTLATAAPERRPAVEVGAAIRDLFGRFRSTFALPAAEIGVLDELVARVERHPGSLPVVLQHGDPGLWNLRVDRDDRVVFFDWESGERHGLPLWDLFYLQRSYGALASRRAGIRDRLEAATRHFVSATALNRRFVDDVRRFAAAVELPDGLVEPMFYACWVHRALKEATRLAPASLDRGHYLRLLRALLAARDAAPLRALTASEVGR